MTFMLRIVEKKTEIVPLKVRSEKEKSFSSFFILREKRDEIFLLMNLIPSELS